jgi:hypothetical protein
MYMKYRMHCHQSPMSRLHRAVASCAFVLALPAVMTACGGRDVVLDKDKPIEPDVIEPGVSVVAEDQQDAMESLSTRIIWFGVREAGKRPTLITGPATFVAAGRTTARRQPSPTPSLRSSPSVRSSPMWS